MPAYLTLNMQKIYTQISKDLYVKIKEELYNEGELSVFGTFTDMEGTMPGSMGMPTIVTEWGVGDADYPLLKYESINEVESFYLCSVVHGDSQ